MSPFDRSTRVVLSSLVSGANQYFFFPFFPFFVSLAFQFIALFLTCISGVRRKGKDRPHFVIQMQEAGTFKEAITCLSMGNFSRIETFLGRSSKLILSFRISSAFLVDLGQLGCSLMYLSRCISIHDILSSTSTAQ